MGIKFTKNYCFYPSYENGNIQRYYKILAFCTEKIKIHLISLMQLLNFECNKF